MRLTYFFSEVVCHPWVNIEGHSQVFLQACALHPFDRKGCMTDVGFQSGMGEEYHHWTVSHNIDGEPSI